MGFFDWLDAKRALILILGLVLFLFVGLPFLNIWFPALRGFGEMWVPVTLLLAGAVVTAVLVFGGIRWVIKAMAFEGIPQDWRKPIAIGMGSLGAVAGPAGAAGMDALIPDGLGLGGIAYFLSGFVLGPLLLAVSLTGMSIVVAALGEKAWLDRALVVQAISCFATAAFGFLYWPEFGGFVALGMLSLVPTLTGEGSPQARSA